MHDDGDIIRGLGFVALNAAYIEEQIDACLEHFIVRGTCGEKLRRKQTSAKIKAILDQLTKIAPISDELAYLPNHLITVGDLLERRNEVIHGRIYADQEFGDIRRSGRYGESDRPATSLELYSLANELSAARGPLLHASVFRLQRFLNNVKN
ncbi:MAG TPA: hypothetical protein VK832_09845 [Burkholderiaceae bacterium]|nr:hypothetical protein [Burkholderiaceae bacterium]